MKRIIVSIAAALAAVCAIGVPSATAATGLGCCDSLHVWAPSIINGVLQGSGEVTGTVPITSIEVCGQVSIDDGAHWTTALYSCYEGPPGTHDRNVVYSTTLGVYACGTIYRTRDNATTSGASATNYSQIVNPCGT